MLDWWGCARAYPNVDVNVLLLSWVAELGDLNVRAQLGNLLKHIHITALNSSFEINKNTNRLKVLSNEMDSAESRLIR